jgi:hypothetical protein
VLCALAGACADAPTFPAALRWLADGEDWVAVLPPADLPSATDWARYSGEVGEVDAVVDRMTAMEAGVVTALTRGDVATAARMRSEAALLLGRSMTRVPDREVVDLAMGAIDLWTTRVALNVRLADTPALAAAVESISADRAAAASALARGDSLAAARTLMDAGERIRAWSPSLVAVRVLQRAETRVAQQANTGTAALRAEHLVRSARDALLAGDPARAMQRAIYALQLAGGQQMPDPPAASR